MHLAGGKSALDAHFTGYWPGICKEYSILNRALFFCSSHDGASAGLASLLPKGMVTWIPDGASCCAKSTQSYPTLATVDRNLEAKKCATLKISQLLAHSTFTDSGTSNMGAIRRCFSFLSWSSPAVGPTGGGHRSRCDAAAAIGFPFAAPSPQIDRPL